MKIRTLWDAWNRFFFEPIAPTSIAVFRIAYGLVLLAYAGLMGPDVLTWLGPRGTLSLETAGLLTGAGRIQLIACLPDGDLPVVVFFGGFVLCVIGVIAGFQTRFCLMGAYVGLVSIHHRNVLILNSGDSLIRVMGFYLMFSQAGSALSLDRRRRIARGLEPAGSPLPSAPWAQRMMQIQLCLVYFMTALEKSTSSYWIGGTALYYSARLEEFWRFPLPYVFEHMWTIQLFTWGTVVLEFALATLVWITELRYPVLLAGVIFHLGIEYTMNIPLFQFIMVASYLLFVEPSDLERWGRALSRRCRPGGWKTSGAPSP